MNVVSVWPRNRWCSQRAPSSAEPRSQIGPLGCRAQRIGMCPALGRQSRGTRGVQSLGLTWPKSRVKPCKGRPTTRCQWQKQVYLHLRMGRMHKVKDLDANMVLPHWEPGVEVDAEPLVTVSSAMASAAPTPSGREPQAVQDEKKRRKKTTRVIESSMEPKTPCILLLNVPPTHFSENTDAETVRTLWRVGQRSRDKKKHQIH